MTWLRVEPVTLASGGRSEFKIECDDLTDEEMAAQCALLAKILPPYREVYGVPTGGERVAEAMRAHAHDWGHRLVVDDVWTTGGSMRRFIQSEGLASYYGAVLFARGPTPPWVTSLWTLHPGLWTA